jgi:hypothetical protein
MNDAGMGKLLSDGGPRAQCTVLAKANETKEILLDENAQRLLIDSIQKSYRSYISGVKCWAAFCDALGKQTHFPATEQLVLQYMAVFKNDATLAQYLKHLRWSHRFLRMDPASWYTPTVKQAIRGLGKGKSPSPPKIALSTSHVRGMIRIAEEEGELQFAALMALARQFLLRVPSEGLPLQWEGTHSSVSLAGGVCQITLRSRKNSRVPVTMTRTCCCSSASPRLCGLHWLLRLGKNGDEGKIFTISKDSFSKFIKRAAADVGVPNADRTGTHAFRRGMAQDLLESSGSLAEVLRAGGWSSSAYLRYLRSAQLDDKAVAQMVIELSDSEGES